ncbi:MAG TPA: response regulator, partial [Aggregicoccus sp.]|nr:response regulator [Aggregicoccus sp.]
MAAPYNCTSILIVDDHPANLLALEATLAPLGQRLVRATSGPEALRHLLEEDFACIVLDVQMPGLDGFQTARLIKERERSRHTPLIFLTAVYRDPSYVLQGYAQGAVDYILKPVDPDILRTKVAVFVDLHLQLRRMSELRGQLPDAECSLRSRESLRRLHAALEVLRAESAPLPSLEAAVTTAPVGLGLLDPQLRYLRLNAALAALHGLRVEEAPGRSLWELAPELAQVASTWLHERGGAPALSGRVVSQELPPGSGHWRHLLSSLTRGPEGLELAAVDLTQQPAAAQLLHSAIRQLAAAAEGLFLPLDATDAPRRIARRVVERVADCCLVDLLDAAGQLEPAALAHVRPDREPLLRELRAGRGPGLLSTARLRALDERRSQVVRPSLEELLARASENGEQSRLLRALG